MTPEMGRKRPRPPEVREPESPDARRTGSDPRTFGPSDPRTTNSRASVRRRLVVATTVFGLLAFVVCLAAPLVGPTPIRLARGRRAMKKICASTLS